MIVFYTLYTKQLYRAEGMQDISYASVQRNKNRFPLVLLVVFKGQHLLYIQGTLFRSRSYKITKYTKEAVLAGRHFLHYFILSRSLFQRDLASKPFLHLTTCRHTKFTLNTWIVDMLLNPVLCAGIQSIGPKLFLYITLVSSLHGKISCLKPWDMTSIELNIGKQ